jgi:hypothetical protein
MIPTTKRLPLSLKNNSKATDQTKRQELKLWVTKHIASKARTGKETINSSKLRSKSLESDEWWRKVFQIKITNP